MLQQKKNHLLMVLSLFGCSNYHVSCNDISLGSKVTNLVCCCHSVKQKTLFVTGDFFPSIRRMAGRFMSLHPKEKTQPFWLGFSFGCSNYLSSRTVSSQVLSALVSLTSVFGMRTGGTSPLSSPQWYIIRFP